LAAFRRLIGRTMTTTRSKAFVLFHQAIVGRSPMTCTYKGLVREICPHILGDSGPAGDKVFQA